MHYACLYCVFFFNDTATTEIYTLSLHDALPISHSTVGTDFAATGFIRRRCSTLHRHVDRKSTRLNSSHDIISYAVFCLEKKSTRLNSSHDIISYAVFCFKNKTKHITSL